MNETVKFGIHLPLLNFGGNASYSREELLSLALKIESLGYDSLIVYDCGIIPNDTNKTVDSIEILSDIAAVTSRIKLGTSSLNIVARHPIICTKVLSSIDISSKGRLFATGVSPETYSREYNAYGISFEERLERFTESLQIMNLIWNNQKNDRVVQGREKSSLSLLNFDGRYYRIKGLAHDPIPVQKPHPPIYVDTAGSSFEQLNSVAKYGDGWMIRAHEITVDKFKERWDIIRSYRHDLGNDLRYFTNAIVSMFGYVDNNKNKPHMIAKRLLSPVLKRSVQELESKLLFGSIESSIMKLNELFKAGVQSIHFWPVYDFKEQIEIFSKKIMSQFP